MMSLRAAGRCLARVRHRYDDGDFVKLTKELIEGGIGYRKCITVSAYDDAEVEIRPLSDLEFARILNKTNLSDTEGMGADLMKKANLPEVGKLYDLMIAMCKVGIVDPDLRGMVDQLVKGASVEIGAEILTLTTGPEEEVKDFSMVPKDN